MIDLKGMRVVYGDEMYRALAIVAWKPEQPKDEEEKKCKVKINNIAVMVLNENGQVMILDDEAWMFQFLMEARPN